MLITFKIFRIIRYGHFVILFLGASLASFIGLVVDRFPKESILFPASHCNTCGKQLRPLDMIPVLSQIFNHSRCHFCKSEIPLWYGIFEFVCGLATALYYHDIIAPSSLFIVFFSMTLSLYDLKTVLSSINLVTTQCFFTPFSSS